MSVRDRKPSERARAAAAAAQLRAAQRPSTPPRVVLKLRPPEIDWEVLPIVEGVELPAGWPTLTLPIGTLLPKVLPPATPERLEYLRMIDGATFPLVSAPKRARTKGTAVGCKCGNEDKTLFMLSCDDCGKWFHGACVGVEEDAAHSAEHWACRTCAAAEARRQEKAEARRARYCVCRAPWDGKSFMIECNDCGEWYHGACVGLNIATTTEATEAAFKKWNCPFCVTGGLLAATAAPSGGRVYGRGRSRGRRAQPSSEPPSPVTPATPAAPAAPSTSPSLLDALTDDCVALVVAALPLPSVLLSFVPLSRRCAELAEAPIRAFCVAQRWQVPRRAQGRPFAWRQLLRSRACAVCLAATAPFPARRGDAIVFRLCKGCARRDVVQDQARWHDLEIDAIGENGQALYPQQFRTPLHGPAHGFAA